MDGEIERFDLGPSELTGKEGKNAMLNVKIDVETQTIFIDGASRLGHITTAPIHVDIGLLPSPKFDFHTTLNFASLLSFKLDAVMYGTVTGTNTKDLNFKLHGEFSNEILDFLTTQGEAYIKGPMLEHKQASKPKKQS